MQVSALIHSTGNAVPVSATRRRCIFMCVCGLMLATVLGISGCAGKPASVSNNKQSASEDSGNTAEESESDAAEAQATADSDSDPAQTDTPEQVAMEVESDEETVAEPAVAEADSGQASTNGDSHETLAGDPATEPAAEPAPPTFEMPTPSRRRILFMPPTGPVVVDLMLTTGEHSFDDGLEHHAIQLIKHADGNSDGKTTWSELLEDDLLVNLAINEQQNNGEMEQRETILKSYDRNGNRIVEPTEILRLFDRNTKGYLGLGIQAEPLDASKSVLESGVRKWLDQNGDGILSTEDKQNAPARLRDRDADQDDRLYAVDFREAPAAMGMMPMNYQPRRRGPSPLRAIHDDLGVDEWRSVQTDLEEIYAFGSEIAPDDFAERRDLFTSLDDNEDEVLQLDEMVKLNELDADFVLYGDTESAILTLSAESLEAALQKSANAKAAALAAIAAKEAADAKATELAANEADATEEEEEEEEEEDLAEESESKAAEEPEEQVAESTEPSADYYAAAETLQENRSLVTTLHGTTLRFEVAQTSNPVFAGDAATAFKSLDRDKNQYLDQNEAIALRGLLPIEFGNADTDDDMKLDMNEVQAIYDIYQSYRSTGLRLNVGSADDPIFLALDTNKSGGLEAREIQTAGEKLSEIDANRDGHLGVSELPSIITISMTSRYQPNNGQLAVTPNQYNSPTSRQKKLDVPNWFTQMDHNRDGEISRLEFIGSEASFEKLDANSDGFVAPAEVAKVPE